MQRRTIISTVSTAAALALVLAACGEDQSDTTASNSDGADNGAQTPTTVKTPAKIKIAGAGSPASGLGRAESTAAGAPAADTSADSKIAGSYWIPTQYTYVAGPGLADLTGARTSWFFPADGHVVTDEQRAALLAAFGMSGEWAALPADWGGGEAVGPTDGSGANLTISADAMRSWWYNPGPSAFPASEPCVTSVDPATGEERTECPTPTPPANVPDKAGAEAKARELFAAMGLDVNQYEFEAYADEWGAWVNAWLLLDGQRTPLSTYVGFGADGVVTGAGGFLARPIQGDQYDLVGIAEGIERLNDQQFGWIGLGGAMAKGGVADASVASVEPMPVEAGAGAGVATETTSDPATGDQTPVTAAPLPVDSVLVDPAVEPPTSVEPEQVTVTLTGVKADLTMVWDAEGTVWLLPAYTFTDDQGGQYQIIAIDDSFIELPEAPVIEPAPEPLPAESVAPAVPDQAAADTLVGLTEEEALKLAETNGWVSRVVARDGEQFPATMDLVENRVNLTIEAGVVTAVTLG